MLDLQNTLARSEAQSLLAMMLEQGEAADAIRRLIVCNKAAADINHRKKVLLWFEILRWKHRKRREGTALPPILRNLVVPLLQAGLSQREVRQRIPVGPLAVARIAKEIGASYLKPHGRGRRFTPEFRERIRQAVASGRPSAEIERELKIDAHTVSEMRHELGDFENRKHRTKLTPEQIQEAERQIRSGRRWRDVADEFDVSPSTLLNRLGYRKHGLKHFTPDEERQVLAAVRRGEGQRRIAIQLGRPRSSVSLLVHRLRKLDPTLPQRAGLLFEVRTAIINARIKGHHTFAHIAQTFSLSPGGVFRIIKRESERRGAA